MSEGNELSPHYPPIEEPLIEPSTKQNSNNESNDALSVFPLTARSHALGCFGSIAAGARNIDWRVLSFGQVISFFVVSAGAASSELEEKCDFSAPAFQCSFTFILLMTHCFVGNMKFCCCKQSSAQEDDREGQSSSDDKDELPENADDDVQNMYINAGNSSSQTIPSSTSTENITHITGGEGNSSRQTFPSTSTPMRGKWWLYVFLAFLQVESNFFIVLAYRYTTITSISLLTSISAPAAMVGSRFLLKWKYGLVHAIGVCICLSGSIVNILIDAENENGDANKKHNKEILGDFIAIVGAILSGATDSLTELVCKKFSPQEYLSMIGFFGTIISVVQILILEMGKVAIFFGGDVTCSRGWAFALLSIFSTANFLSMTSQAYFLRISEAALLNLSQLTVNIYAVLFSITFERIAPHPLFYLAVSLTVIGIFVYESAPSPMDRIELNQTL